MSEQKKERVPRPKTNRIWIATNESGHVWHLTAVEVRVATSMDTLAIISGKIKGQAGVPVIDVTNFPSQ